MVVVDDGSTDGTPDILARHIRQDRRIRDIKASGRGPAAARNLAIAQARGRWIAVVDADDFIKPDRLALMVDAGDRQGVDAVADNMVAFYDSGAPSAHAWIAPAIWSSPRLLTFEDMMKGGLGDPPKPELGYLKPLLRRDRLTLLGQPYREDLMIGEDFDLMARWTSAGLSYLYLPEAGYLYRRRASSISYRLSAVQIDQMIKALDGLDRAASRFDERSVGARKASLEAMRRYAQRVDRLKRRDLSALAPLLVDGDYRRKLAASAHEGLRRRLDVLGRRRAENPTQREAARPTAVVER